MARGSACSVCGGPNVNQHRGDTYVLQYAGTVKIGISIDLVARVDALSRGTGDTWSPWDGPVPLTPVCAFVGDVEHELHEMFAEAHIGGEWFEAEPVLAAMPGLVERFATVPIPTERRRIRYVYELPTVCEWLGVGLFDRKCKRPPVEEVLRGVGRRRVPVCEVHARQGRDRRPLRKRRRRAVPEWSPTSGEDWL